MSTKTYSKYAMRGNVTPQLEQADPSQQLNNAGGYSFTVTPWNQLNRFLILGSESGTYYVAENKLTKDNAKNIIELIKKDGINVIKKIIEVSDEGKAPKNDAAIFALALCISEGDEETRKFAYQNVNKVCRIGTHLFHLADYVTKLKGGSGWGKGLRKAFARFYTTKTPQDVAYQLFKYKQRDGWSHGDILNLSHPWADYHGELNKDTEKLFKYVTKNKSLTASFLKKYPFVESCLKVQEKDIKVKDVIKEIKENNLPREVLPTEMLNDAEIWRAMLPSMPITALIRNLGNLSKNGITKPLSKEVKIIIDKLLDVEQLKKGRVHPLSILLALRTYAKGHSLKGNGEWEVSQPIADALNDAFYLSYQSIEPTNKNYYIGLDVSGSMSSDIAGLPLSSAEAVGALSMIFAATEPQVYVKGFCDSLVDLGITPKQRLDDIMQKVQRGNFGSTDCSQPMLDAINQKLDVDVFMVMTDSETYAGSIHPHEALAKYNKQFKKNAKLIVLATTATSFSIADPKNKNMLDICGFSTDVPTIISEFVKGNI